MRYLSKEIHFRDVIKGRNKPIVVRSHDKLGPWTLDRRDTGLLFSKYVYTILHEDNAPSAFIGFGDIPK